MNLMNDLEQQGDMMVEPSSETIRSYIFKTDGLCMMADIAWEKQSFEDIFREPPEKWIVEVIRIDQHFPKMVEKEESMEIMEVVTMEELHLVSHSFQKDKILEMDGWGVEFFFFSGGLWYFGPKSLRGDWRI